MRAGAAMAPDYTDYSRLHPITPQGNRLPGRDFRGRGVEKSRRGVFDSPVLNKHGLNVHGPERRAKQHTKVPVGECRGDDAHRSAAMPDVIFSMRFVNRCSTRALGEVGPAALGGLKRCVSNNEKEAC